MDGPTEFARHTGIEWGGPGGHVGTVKYDSSMVVLFFTKPMHNPAKSVESGSPVYEDKVFVRVHPPGERLNIVERPATGNDASRWPTQWSQFQQNQQQIPDGTPIDILYPDQPSIAAMLRAGGVHTIEQCAELSAHAIETIGMGAQRYVNAAQDFIAKARQGIKITQYRKDMEEKDREIRVLKQQLDDLKGIVANMQKVQGGGLTQEQVLQLLAGNMQRPQHLPSAGFDPQTAQINATHGSVQPRQKPKRSRPRLKA